MNQTLEERVAKLEAELQHVKEKLDICTNEQEYIRAETQANIQRNVNRLETMIKNAGGLD